MKILRVVARIALIVLGLGLCAITLYGLWRFVRAYWPAILFYGYLTPAVIYALFAAIIILRQGPPGMSPRDRMLQALGAAADRASKFTKLRRIVGGILDAVSSLVAWPVYLYSSIRSGAPKKSMVNTLATAALNSLQVKRAVFLMVVVCVVTLIDRRVPAAAVYGNRFLYIIVVSMICRHLAYSVGAVSLPQTLRRSKGNSYLRYVAVLIADFATYVIAFGTLVAGGPAEPVARLVFISKEIFAFNSVGDFFHSGVITRESFLIAIAGFTYYIGLVQTAIKLNDFTRVDDDYHSLAHTHILLGEYVEGLKLLSQVRAVNATTYGLNVAAFIGVDQLEKAHESAQIVVKLGQNKAVRDEDTYIVMLNTAAIYAIPEPLLLRVLKQALESGTSDFRVHSTLAAMSTTSAARMEAIYDALSAYGIDKYPLSAAFLLIEMKRGREAFDVLNGYAPVDEKTEFVRQYLVLASRFSSDFTTADDDLDAFEKWAVEELPKVESLIEATADESEKLGLLGIIEQLKRFAEVALPHRQQQLEYVVDEVRRKLEKSASREALAAMKSVDRFIMPKP